MAKDRGCRRCHTEKEPEWFKALEKKTTGINNSVMYHHLEKKKEKRKKEKEKKQFCIPAFPNAEIQFLLKNSGCILVLKKDILCFQLK